MANKPLKKTAKTKPEGKKPAAKAAQPARKAAAPKGRRRPSAPAKKTAAAQEPVKTQVRTPQAPAPARPTSKTERPAMPQMLFYEKPVILNRDAHRNLKIRSVPSFAFAANTNSVPMTGNEFAAAARQIPILFIADANNRPSPIGLVGLRRDENLFVDADGRWTGNYIPAFIRRYPFVLIENKGVEDLAVGIDEAFAGFNGAEGEPMFDGEGKDGPALQRAISFLNAYQADAKRTLDFASTVARLDLLVPQAINVQQKDGQKYKLDGFSVVDEARLTRLDDAESGNLLRNGYLGWIYMHLLSINNITELSTRLDTRVERKTA